jgi:hypothetical protein
MRSGGMGGTAGFVGFLSFLFGLSFYHFILLGDVPGVPVLSSSVPFSSSSSPGGIPLEELVKGPLPQNDSRLLELVRGRWLRDPASPQTPYNLSEPSSVDPSMGQSKMVRSALHNLRGGFFVEAGALDGELRSNTLLLERKYGWSVRLCS